VSVGTLFLELCTERAGEIEVLKALPPSTRVGVGVVNQKHERVGFATFADNPVASAQVAEAKLLAIRRAAEILRRG
jgi:5-methyltetrahydropteroyltriglutamate--homocysteine methyltransferase